VAVYLGTPPTDGFARVPNDWLRDPKVRGLSKAVLAYFLSHRSGYRLTVKQMAAEFKEGEDALYAAVNDLVAAGYVKRVQRRTTRGVVGEVDFLVIGMDGEFPQVEPLRALPHPENPEPVATCDDAEFPQVGTASGFTASGSAGSGKSGSKKTRTKKTTELEEHEKTTGGTLPPDPLRPQDPPSSDLGTEPENLS
jgi:hypothetical protein